MRYSVKCNKCGQKFAAEPETFGRQKYRCPYCRQVVMCEFNPPKPFTVHARSVVPILGLVPMGPNGQPMPTVPSKVVTTMDTLQDAGSKVVRAGRQTGKQVHTTVDWALDHLTIFFGVSFARIRRFREEYTDADMWLFFGFSVLFILLVIAGLFICAQLTKAIVSSQAWIIHELPFLRGWL